MDTRQQAVTDALRRLVMQGALPPGAHVTEVALARRLGVSRTPVRTALATLAQEGLLVYRPQRGYLVRSFSLADMLNAYRVRATLEGLACRIVAENGLPDAGAETLRACLAEGDAILAGRRLRDEDNAAWIAMNDRFHQTILDASGNASLIDVTRRTLGLPFLSTRVVHWHEYQALAFSHHLHHVIFKAIRRGEASRADAAMREHIWQATEIIERRYEDMVRGAHAGAKEDSHAA